MTTEPTFPRRTLLAGAGATALLGALTPDAAAAKPVDVSPGGARPDELLIGPVTGRSLHVMSYNIRFDKDGTEPGQADYWPERAPLLRRLLQLERPSLLGIQEAQFHQLAHVRNSLPATYDVVGYGREGGSKGEFSAIFYDRARFELRAWDQFWLSDTPNVIGSATWGNTVPRIVTWARLLDRNTRKPLVFVNTHFDHESAEARSRSAKALVDLVKGLAPTLPVIVTGDFNDLEGSAAHTTLLGAGGLRDAWHEAKARLTPAWGTVPDYADPVVGAKRIDWILTTPNVRVHRVAINVTRFGGRYPSDHAAVQALLEL